MKNFLMRIILHFLYKGIKILNNRDSYITNDIKNLPDNYKIKIETNLKNGKCLCIQKDGNKIKKTKNEGDFNLIIKFKNKNLAYQVLLGKVSIADAFAKHYFVLYGNIYEAMAVTRILERAEGYLFPKFINKKILKEPIEREISFFKTYLLCLFT